MKVRLLIASTDSDYVEHLSRVLSDKHTSIFEVSVCTQAEYLEETLGGGRFDVALMEPDLAASAGAQSARLLLVLWDEGAGASLPENAQAVRKYQRISALTGAILEAYAELAPKTGATLGGEQARVTAVWSPGGGAGKTTVALAYAARRVASGRQVTYLSLESFSSVGAYFPQGGRSISAAFEKLGSDIHMLLMGIRQQDSGSGIAYYCGPDNYDDMNILTAQDIEALISVCAAGADELVLDLSSQCDERVWKAFELADTVLVVCDASSTCQVKLGQFLRQHNVYPRIAEKAVLVANKGARPAETGMERVVQLPLVHGGDATSVYKTLSGNMFEW